MTNEQIALLVSAIIHAGTGQNNRWVITQAEFYLEWLDDAKKVDVQDD